ncbi:hypothetical protein CGRA01v4_01226 [Colletotrichum graminicola]|uniref:DNA2/NAM7 helicase helicase domain-containing protein n=1 Tax=Colletotrichum graminicola (strain M1.001 / M2 / FGSC 10212) TaxID=645133 RepID=E3QGD0_COLGM|nr:uncharacterized protein GLRG_05062 [Colletotrichum graminicola M1.001]EFQ29918.1 hypothetical protein GLRG_05062 [Colletotrichum graminicola M1.001]WDK09947.1 hypothetical protein CGRA01v4_01226 [Colletotrichum graminicola]
MTFYAGGPGSGKTTWGIRLLRTLGRYNAACSVHSNDLCDDAANKLGATCRNSRVARAYRHERMLRALTGQLEYSQVVPSTMSSQYSQAQRQVIRTVTDIEDTARQENPLARADSLVSLALSIAKNNPDFDEFNALRTSARKTDEELSRLTIEANRLLAYALVQVNILVGTPVALGSIARASKLEHKDLGRWNPHIIFMDETGRMPESQFYIPMAFFKPTWVIAAGDTQQFKPMSKSMDLNGERETGFNLRSIIAKVQTEQLLGRPIDQQPDPAYDDEIKHIDEAQTIAQFEVGHETQTQTNRKENVDQDWETETDSLD